ncbi:MAG: H-NS histone family protein [Rhodobacteraceae bacterium]|jgi:DNA-binding protein H-NS|nr:H-NS histone family protein [Paracoccaceae bacterium]
MSIDLNEMSLRDLKELQSRVTKAILTFEDRKKREALAELEEIARSKGFSLAELTGTSGPKKRAPATAKYANPANSAETWSGRGRKPRWFDAALKSGKSPSDLAI